MLKKLALAFAFSLIASSAFAVCSAIPLPIADFAGVSRSMSSATAADGNCKTYIDADTASQLHTDITAPIVAGSNIIGKVGIDQTTPGTTNGVQVNAALPAGTNLVGKAGIDQTTPGTTNAVSVQYGATASVADPCQTATKVYTPINVVTATNTIIVGVAAKKKYVCGIFLYPGGTDNIAIFQATTGTACATALVAVIGGTTTATGILATAQAGFVLGTGASAVAATTVNQTDLCIVTSAAVQLSGVVVTVDQ